MFPFGTVAPPEYRAYERSPVRSLRIAARQPVLFVGFTHASRVIPDDRCRSAASLIVTQSLTPSNLSALPVWPVVVQVASRIVPVWPRPVVSVSVVPDPFSNE